MRPTPFGLVFAQLAGDRFAEIADEPDRDRFVLQAPVGRLLRELIPDDAGPDALEAHVRMLHHAHRHWTAGGWVYRIGEETLSRATGEAAISSRLPHPAIYLQLPELRVWGAPTAEGEGVPEPLDGMFVTTTGPGAIAVLGIFGVRPDRPGFGAVSVDGRADADDPAPAELLVAAAREDGSAPFSPTLAGGERAGLFSVANAGELLLLTCRLLALLPPTRETGNVKRETIEHIVPVE